MERSDQKWLFPVFLAPKSKSLGELFMEHSFKRLKLKGGENLLRREDRGAVLCVCTLPFSK